MEKVIEKSIYWNQNHQKTLKMIEKNRQMKLLLTLVGN